jgi:hypothetical protein
MILQTTLELHFIIGSLSSAMMALMGFFLLRSYAKIRMRASLFVAIGTIGGAIWALCSTIYPSVPDVDTASTIYIIGVLASYVMINLIFVFTELIKMDKVRPSRGFFNGALTGAITFLLLMRIAPPVGFGMPFVSGFGYYAAAQLPFLVLQLVLILNVAFGFTATALQMRRSADTQKRRRQTLTLLVGSSIAFYGAIVALVLVEIIFIPSLVLLVTAIGISLVALSFGRDPEVAYFLPYDVSILVVLGESGMPLFTHRFSKIEINEVMFSGAISAISSLMKESLKSREAIKLVQMESHSLVLDLRANISAFVMTNRGGAVLQAGLSAFLTAFSNQFREQLTTQQTHDLNVFAPASELVYKYLGFLRGCSTSQTD